MDQQQLKIWLNNFHNQEHIIHALPLIMGILNITPDSFSDGGKYLDHQMALQQTQLMIAAGADIIDIGGESSRPGATSVSVDEELARVIPVIKLIRQHTTIALSIDTTKAPVMRAAVAAGATMINDINGLRNQDSLQAAYELNVPVCIMHMQGVPQTMQIDPQYNLPIIDVVDQFFTEQISRCVEYGMKRENIIIDPGFGFGKTMRHNLLLLKNAKHFKQHNLPIMLGFSRKSTLGLLTGKPVHERLIPGIAVSVFVYLQQVSILRTHDVDETKQALQIVHAILQA